MRIRWPVIMFAVYMAGSLSFIAGLTIVGSLSFLAGSTIGLLLQLEVLR